MLGGMYPSDPLCPSSSGTRLPGMHRLPVGTTFIQTVRASSTRPAYRVLTTCTGYAPASLTMSA